MQPALRLAQRIGPTPPCGALVAHCGIRHVDDRGRGSSAGIAAAIWACHDFMPLVANIVTRASACGEESPGGDRHRDFCPDVPCAYPAMHRHQKKLGHRCRQRFGEVERMVSRIFVDVGSQIDA